MIEDPSLWVEKPDNGWDADKHYEERKARGFSKADWINFDTYIAWVIANAVQKMKDDGHTMFSFPDEPSERWEELTNAEYDIMIKGFGGHAVEEALDQDDLNAALDIFKKRFRSLWD